MKTLPEPRLSPPATVPSPLHGRPRLTARDAARVAAAIEAEIAPSTSTLYASAWRTWEEWCDKRGITAMPCHPDALAAYLAQPAEEGLAGKPARFSFASTPTRRGGADGSEPPRLVSG